MVFADGAIDLVAALVAVLGFESRGSDPALPSLDGENLVCGEAEGDETIARIAVAAQLGEDAAGGALRGGGWVVQLVGEIAGELAEGGEFFALLLDASDLADAVEEGVDGALAERGDGLHHLREHGFVEQERPDRLDGEALATVACHAGKRQEAGHLSCASDEERHRTGALASDVDFALEDEDHLLGGHAFFKEGVAGLDAYFLTMTCQPLALTVAEAVERDDVIDGFGDLEELGRLVGDHRWG
uniref:Uncharacterized protein n=1 Tax=mine drainage metagenome TaxID=410659 RepID=E6QI92_9ZZZZ